MLKKLNDFTFYKDTRFYCSFPSIAKLDDGKLLLMFRRARDVRYLVDKEDSDNKQVLLIKSQVDHIDGRSQLVSIHLDQQLNCLTNIKMLASDPEVADQDASLLVLNNNHILLSSFSWYPLPARLAPLLREKGVDVNGTPDGSGCHYIMWGGFTALSKDGGMSWSERKYLPKLPIAEDIIPNKRISFGGPIRGQAIESNDEILLPVYRYIKTLKTDSCHLYVSKDKGESWIYRSTIANDYKQNIHFQEPSLIRCGNGKIMAFMRTTNAGDHIYTAISDDNGKSWAKPIKRKKVIGHPIHPLKLKDGRIFICYGYRHKPFGIRGRLMDSNGKTYIANEIVIREDGFCADIGYPWAIQLDNNNILVVYYFTKNDGIRYISGTTIQLV